MIYTLDKKSCIKTLSLKDGLQQQSMLCVQNQEATIFLKPCKSYQKTNKGEQLNQNNIDNSVNLQQSHPKRQIKIPVQLNL